jgi:hypothetical protein
MSGSGRAWLIDWEQRLRCRMKGYLMRAEIKGTWIK